ncbi:hypothetical protein [Lichenihabitans psoromatis]|uniref:hypothetical protein n=1 Tax=Lichenihabitans psoromatis TaxID=2528642 RepID=UPI00103846D6|nr:hypothetical protein [Lichenihabitans psoromatis]
MAIPTWPTDVPYTPMTSGLTITQLANPLLSTDMNAGTTRQRRKYTLRIAEMKLVIRMTPAQFASFHAFHQAIGDGAARFTMPVWNGSGYVTRTVQIKDQPDMSPLAFRARSVGFSLRIENL